MMKRHLWMAVVLTGCVQIESVGPAGSADGEVPARIQGIFDGQCAVAGCHDATTQAAGLSLAAGDSGALLSGASANQEPGLALVERGSVEDSYLAIKLLAEPPPGRSRQGERMPLGGASDPDEIAVLIGWIAGAEVGDPMDEDPVVGDEGDGGSTAAGGCGVETIAASGVATIDVGMDASRIPPVIGDVLLSNCGCHLAETLIPEVQPHRLALPFDLTTLDGWRATVDGRQAASVIGARVVEQESMPPAYACDDGSGEAMAPGDRDLLAGWIEAGLPGGDAWP